MGNDQSQMPGLEIDEKAVEVTDFYAHYAATLDSSNIATLTVFIGEPLIGGSLWLLQTPLEKSSKVLQSENIFERFNNVLFLELNATSSPVYSQIHIVVE